MFLKSTFGNFPRSARDRPVRSEPDVNYVLLLLLERLESTKKLVLINMKTSLWDRRLRQVVAGGGIF
jgi:hypothetical protein